MPNEAAMSLMAEGITLFVSAGDQSALGSVVDALKKFRELAYPYGIGLTLTALGEAARLKGDYELAKTHFAEALATMRKVGNVYWIEALLLNLAQVRLQLQDWRGAVPLLREALDAARGSENPLSVVYYIAAMARVALLRSKAVEAAGLFGASSSLLKSLGATMEPADQAEFDSGVAAVTTELGTDKFQLFFGDGATWSTERAIAEAMALQEELSAVA
jgi:tetratricopeptide (TPR) repeat protein